MASSSGWRGSAESSSVTLASRQTSARRRRRRRRLADDRERVDLDQVGVVGDHRPHEALGDRRRPRAGAGRRGPSAKASWRACQSSSPSCGWACDRCDGLGRARGDLLDLDPALGRAHDEDPPARPVEDRGEVELLDDVGGRRDEHLADGDALDRHAEDGAGAAVSASAPDPASLTPPALPRPPTRTWALMTTRSAPAARNRSAAARASAASGRPPTPGRAGPGRRAGSWRRLPGSSRGLRLRGGLGAEPGDAMVPRRSARAGPNRGDRRRRRASVDERGRPRAPAGRDGRPRG